jgi:hypothetical protein
MVKVGIIRSVDFTIFQSCNAVGPIAQSVEQRTFNPWVDGSSPSGPTSRHLATSRSERMKIFERTYFNEIILNFRT